MEYVQLVCALIGVLALIFSVLLDTEKGKQGDTERKRKTAQGA